MLREVVHRASFWLLVATLALLPFEFVLPDDHVLAGYTLTTLEIAGLAALGTWLARLAAERRLPQIELTIALALAALVGIGFASAVLAPGLNGVALDAAVHGAAGGLLFLAVADTALRDRRETVLASALVVGATASALIGLVAFAAPSLAGPLNLGEFTTTGTRRLAGTLDYPNTAAMFYEASALIAIGLAVVTPRRVLGLAFAAATAILLAALILTLSRGAVMGTCAGLVVLALAALAGAPRGQRRTWLAVTAVAAVAVTAVALPLALARSDGAVANPPLGEINARYVAPASGRVANGRMVIPVEITNTGSRAWNVAGADQYRLGFHWLTPDATRLLGDGGQQTPIGPLAPGETKVVQATVHALPPTLGHVVAWDVFIPGQLWLSQYGVPVATTQVVAVGVPGEQPLPPPTIARQLDLYEDLVLPPNRDQLWSAAIAMTAERPLLGHGPGTFQLRYGPYLGDDDWDTDIHANNTYLELSATTGMLGLAAFVVLVGLVGVALLARVFRPPPTVPRGQTMFAAAVAAALVAFLTHGVVDYFVGFNPTGGLFWAILGLGLVAGRPRP